MELLGCSAYVMVGMMRLQPACQQLKPPVHARWMRWWARGAFMHASTVSRIGNGSAHWCGRGKCCQARPIELLGCSAYVVVGMMRLQPACQQLKPPMHAVNAMGTWRIHACSHRVS